MYANHANKNLHSQDGAKNMTKTETHFTFRRCNLCDSPRIVWHDNDDTNHLCKECYKKDTDVYADEDTVGYVG